MCWGDDVVFQHFRETHLTLTLLARLARMLQGALLAQMGRCPRFYLTLLTQLALQVALLAHMGHSPISPSDDVPVFL